jgi:S1-C subfamily serine protease
LSHNHPAFSCFRDRLTLKLADSTKFLELNRPGFDILSSLAVLFGLPVRRGFLIQDVFPGSPAHLAGLRAGSRAIVLGENLYVIGGDVVTYINGKDVSALSQIMKAILESRPGQYVTLIILSEGQMMELALPLEPMHGPWR